MTELFLNWLQSLMDFSTILNSSIAASWMVLAVLILRFALKKSPKWVYVALWGLVAVRLIMPFSVESAFSLIPSVQTIPREILRYQGTQLSRPAYIDIVTNPNLLGDVSVQLDQSVDRVQWRMLYMTFVWLVGIAVMLLYASISYWRLHHKVATAVLYKDNIFQSENVESPFVLGIIKPKIYLPFNINGQDIVHIISHENAHIARKDHWWKPLGFVLLSIHWFNPVMWLAYTVLCRDIELACDEKVIKDLENEQRADYTLALVSCSINRRIIAACPLAFGEVSVKERVKSVMNYKKPVLGVTVLSVIACIIMAVCFLTNPERDKYTIRIVVPAGSSEQFVYSDEEIRAIGREITITAGDNLPDTEVLLKPVDDTVTAGYVAEYITPGLPVKFDADKDLWLKVGVNIQNHTDEDFVVYVNVKNVEVRIEDAETEKMALIPMVMINGQLYLDTGYESTLTKRNDVIDGEITGQVPAYEKPVENNQSNFGVGYRYQIGVSEGTVELLIDDKWWIFATEEARRKIQFPDKEHSETDKAYRILIENLNSGQCVEITPTEQITTIASIVSSAKWTEGTADCLSDFKIIIGDKEYLYHLSCGTINDVANNRSMPLDDTQKTELHKIVEELYYSMTGNVPEGSRPISLPFLEAGKYIMPLDMKNENVRISRGFSGQYPSHDGLDIAAPLGTDVFASADGTVVKAEESTSGDGNHVVVRHANGYYTLYAHCSELTAVEGAEVKQGEVIAKVGSTGNSTGPHLHFELIFGYESEEGGLSIDVYNAVAP